MMITPYSRGRVLGTLNALGILSLFLLLPMEFSSTLVYNKVRLEWYFFA